MAAFNICTQQAAETLQQEKIKQNTIVSWW